MISMITMSVPVAKPTFAYLTILALIGLGCAQDTLQDSQVEGVDNPTSSVALPVCGRVTPHQTPLGTNGNEPDVRNFPWHANLYAEGDYPPGGTNKRYRCGATIIQPNLLVTSAQCVAMGFDFTVTDPKKLFVMTGNVHREYDSPHNNAESVRRSAVKNVFVHCKFYGIAIRNAKDIALIELEDPLPLSETLSPACLDVAGHSEQLLVLGANGKMAEFGGPFSSDILHTPTLPYISLNQCRDEALNHSITVEWFTRDKFCAGYANEMSAPVYGHGGGLVFQKDGAWYLEGIHSASLFDNSDDELHTKRLYNSLYTKVSLYTGWIQEVISSLQRNESVPACSNVTNEDMTEALASWREYYQHVLNGDPL